MAGTLTAVVASFEGLAYMAMIIAFDRCAERRRRREDHAVMRHLEERLSAAQQPSQGNH